MSPPQPPENCLAHGWKLLRAFYDWEVLRGRTALEAGTRCKIPAYFLEQFLARFFSAPEAPPVFLDQVTAEILDAYLGGWYLTESGLAGPDDLDWQLASLRGLVEYLGAESLYRGSDADWQTLEHHLDDAGRFQRRLRQWEEFRRELAGSPGWIERQERWLSEEW
jgi:hypothetical protein